MVQIFLIGETASLAAKRPAGGSPRLTRLFRHARSIFRREPGIPTGAGKLEIGARPVKMLAPPIITTSKSRHNHDTRAPTEQIHETIHHEAHHSESKWATWVALSTALLAGLAAIAALLAEYHADEALHAASCRERQMVVRASQEREGSDLGRHRQRLAGA